MKKISLKSEDFIEICNGVDYLDQVKELIIEYTKRLGRDLSFQNIDEELDVYKRQVRFQLPTSSSVLLCFEQTSLSLS